MCNPTLFLECTLLLATPSLAPAPPALTASPSTDLRVMEERLSLEETKFRRWRAAWTVTFSSLAIANLALVPAVPREARIDFYVGAATSAAAIPLTLLFRQPEPPTSRGSTDDR